MKRGGSRRTPKSHQKNQNFDDTWSFKPLYESQSDDPKSLPQPSTSRSTSSQFIPSNKARNNKNPNWVSKNHNLGTQFGPKQGEDEANKDHDGNKGKEIMKDLNDVQTDNNFEDDFDFDDVVKRLENLRILSEQEPDLSEDLLINNDQLQHDEVLAMESIYGENIFIMDKQNGMRSFQIHIHIEIPVVLTISTKLNSTQNINTNTNESEDFSYSFEVNYIPPIILTCLLPKSYPTHLPPYFTISVQWLDSLKISSLCSMLDSIWNEQHGQEVIYSWAEWLHSSALSYLGFNKEIILGPYGVKHHGDPRAISGCISPDVDVPSLKSYNDEKRVEDFRKNLQECCICLSEFAGSEFIRLPCQHFFCEKCMKTYADVLVQEGTVMKLSCLTAKCGGMIPPGLLKRLLGDKEFEKWESLTLQKTLESMSDVVYCPRCEMVCIVDEDQHAQCSKCFFSFCTLCRGKRHVGDMCLTPEMKLRVLQERQNSTQMNDKQRKREHDLIEELLSVKEIFRDAKLCPSCKMAISKTEGCNKMVCGNCGKYFCYRCNKAIDGYDHFRDGKCELFPQEDVLIWEAQMNPRQLVGQVAAQLFAGVRQLCPQCGQMNAKVGNNNHIFCWACQSHYCYLCGKIVRRGLQHFGPKGCKQHTVG
uniref:E3 ubiquitin-protein ligase RNF14 n=1 Tax=Erigeron canadensis TaxID=72917 RepID=UPI001CB89E47|nr:E3 ubiquitin-protein ligase RNF14 [Erigeron canadensis]